MSTELQHYLLNKFHLLYDQKNDKFKFDCNDGWFRLILWLNRYLQQYIDHQNKAAEKCPDYYQPVSQIKILQIKENYGTLKFHVEGGNQHTKSIISFVEYISGFVCEFTGKLDDIGYNNTGCIKTHHISYMKDSLDFNYVDDDELRNIFKHLNKSR